MEIWETASYGTFGPLVPFRHLMAYCGCKISRPGLNFHPFYVIFSITSHLGYLNIAVAFGQN